MPIDLRVGLLAPLAALLLIFWLPAQQPESPDDDAAFDWPRQIAIERGTVTIYQPQLEDFDGNRLSGRFAVSVQLEAGEAQLFGAAWLEARVATDRDAREVTLRSVEIPELRFPEADQSQVALLQSLLVTELSSYDITLSLDRLLADLAALQGEGRHEDVLRSAPPKILYVDHPAMLVSLDGEPALQQLEGLSLMRVVNTPFFMVFAPSVRTYYLFGGSEWLRAEEIEGPWERAGAVPSAVSQLAADAGFELEEPPEGAGDSMPQVIVATEPTELLSTDGKPRYTPLGTTDLMYVDNSDNDLLLDIDDQQHYALISGRWYRAAELGGDWQYVDATELPEDFAEIPIGSAKEDLRASVPGTSEAREAVLDAEIPQTAVISRDGPQPDVVYDGEPELVDIDGTAMQYAVNTGAAVLLIEGRYYCCDQAVWYQATTATGPWVVCTAVPPQVQDIPASCPLYYLRFVQIYDSTEDEVYVGYTSGYTGCYIYRGVVVYGTGWWYRPWWRRHYYARPCTWGLRVRYNPRTGNWGFGVGYRGRYGGVVVGRGGWWGTGGFRHSSVEVNINAYGGPAARPADYRQNIYDRRGERPEGRPGDKAAGPAPANRARLDRSSKPQQGRVDNNVYADRDGQVHRRTADGWERHDKSGWQREQKPATQPSQPQSTPQPKQSPPQDRSQLERQYQARQRGTQRTNQYRGSQSRPTIRGGARGRR